MEFVEQNTPKPTCNFPKGEKKTLKTINKIMTKYISAKYKWYINRKREQYFLKNQRTI